MSKRSVTLTLPWTLTSADVIQRRRLRHSLSGKRPRTLSSRGRQVALSGRFLRLEDDVWIRHADPPENRGEPRIGTHRREAIIPLQVDDPCGSLETRAIQPFKRPVDVADSGIHDRVVEGGNIAVLRALAENAQHSRGGALGVSGMGSIEVVPEIGPAPATVVRIDNGASVVVPPLGPENVPTRGTSSALTTPPDGDRQRMNIGLRTLASGATMNVALYDASGALIRARTLALPPDYLIQMPAAELVEGNVGPNQSIVFTVERGSVVVYRSTLSNQGHDSTLQLVRRIEE